MNLYSVIAKGGGGRERKQRQREREMILDESVDLIG